MKLPAPTLPPYDVVEWQKQPFNTRLKWVCQAWAIQGYGTPASVYVVYVLKVALYVGGWLFFCSTSSALGSPREFGTWWFELEAHQEAVLFGMAFEARGLGGGSGPLTGRYVPPIGGVLYFVRPVTTKM